MQTSATPYIERHTFINDPLVPVVTKVQMIAVRRYYNAFI